MRLRATFLASSRTAPKRLHEHFTPLPHLCSRSRSRNSSHRSGLRKAFIRCYPRHRALPQNVHQLTIDIIGYILSQLPATCRGDERQAAISINAALREWSLCGRSGQRCDCTDSPLTRTRIHGDLAMNVGHFEQISDCWSLEGQPATYYRTAAARARILQADATTLGVRQYLDKMIAHCERLAGNVEPGVSPPSDRRYAGRTRLARS